MTKWTVALFALILMIGSVAAQNESAPNGTAPVSGGGLDGIMDGLGDAVDGVGDAVEATGDGIAKGASAVGRGITGAAKWLGSTVVGSVEGVALAGAVVVAAFGSAIIALGGVFSTLGSGVTALTGIAGQSLGAAFAWIGITIWDGILAYAGLVSALRPEAMSVAVFGTVVGAGAAGSAGAGGWAGWQALRKWGLMGGGVLGMAGFSRISDDQLLEHPLRGDIFTVIKTNPGIHASQLARELDVGWGTITHHLDKLQRAKLVTTRRVNNQKCFFEQGGQVSRQDMAIASALKGDTASNIAAFVQAHPMSSQKALAEALGISPALASFHVKKLANLGVLEKIRHGKETLLTTSEGLRRLMESQDPVAAAVFQKAEAGFEYIS